ncbi:hypothetical protein [Ferrimonas balearica]|uniref:hypothetical protein n=1 Tax=Ferrimonas balearica TaxID=44012 RepID=UPI001F225BD5|nr:hypothetical protein [Ferrimonas balearica]MBY6095552.1 hypothetical protein [Ferrimonas balearica]
MKPLFALSLTLFAASSFANIDRAVLPELPNMYVYDQHIVSAGLPKADDYAALKEAGVDVVINVIPHHSKWDKENGFVPDPVSARASGLTHYTVPFESAEPVATMEHFIAVMDRMSQTEQDVLVHCAVNWRASGLVYLYHAIKTGKADKSELKPWGDLEQAFAEAPNLKHFFDVVEAHYGLAPAL